MANTYLTKTFASAGTRTKYTISVWVKKSKLSGDQNIISAGTGANNSFGLRFNSDNTLNWNSYSGSYDYFLNTTRKFTDPSAWYHIVCAFDSTQSTASNRMKIYINGVQETKFLTATYPNVDFAGYFFNNILHEISQDVGSGGYFFDGSMSYFYGIDGTAYAASTFGSTDSTTGQWQINTSPTVTMGTNGFLILKDGNTITDSSSNSNNWSLGGGTLTKTQDCPSNVFPTWNPAFMPFNIGNGRADNGGTTIGSPGGDSSSIASIGARSGKYYWEIRVQNAVNTRSCGIVRSDIQGISSTEAIYPGGNGNASNFTSAYNMVNGYVQTNTSGTQAQQGSLETLTTGDYLGVALDIDNLNIKWFKNAGLVTTTNLTSAWIANGLFLIPANRLDGNQFVEYNFGNGCFGSTQLTGTTYSGTGGLGIFKFEPPTGFTALSTKGLNL